MEIRLNGYDWMANDYIISGDYASGYEVRKKGTDVVVYHSISFESCLTWVWNS